MRERVRELRYEIGDAMGDHAPDYFRRSRSSLSEFLIGTGSVLAALGIGYVAMRLANRQISDLIDNITPSHSMERPNVHGTSGGEMPDTDRTRQRATRRRTERPAAQQSDGAEWPKPEAGSRP